MNGSKAPRFSFILPAYKARFLGKAIESLLSQTLADLEVVVVNDCSPEPVAEAVTPFLADPRLRYYENASNIGGHDLVANWNHCLEYARGEWIVLATDDDLLAPTYLADAQKAIEANPGISLVRQGVMKIGPGGEPLEYELFMPESLSAAAFAYYWGMGIISCVSNFVFRREALLQDGGFISFPHAHYSDVATALRAAAVGGVASVPRYNMLFRMSDENLSNTTSPRLALGQAEATLQFMDWLKSYLDTLPDDAPGRFYAVRAWYGFRLQHRRMMEILLSKLPRRSFPTAIRLLARCRHLYKKEKAKLFLDYLL